MIPDDSTKKTQAPNMASLNKDFLVDGDNAPWGCIPIDIMGARLSRLKWVKWLGLLLESWHVNVFFFKCSIIFADCKYAMQYLLAYV